MGFLSAKVPVRLRAPAAVANNGLLEADTGSVHRGGLRGHAGGGTGERNRELRSGPGGRGCWTCAGEIDGPTVFHGGCDGDQYPDADEVLNYTVAILNASREDDFTEVMATLTPSGPGGVRGEGAGLAAADRTAAGRVRRRGSGFR